MTDNKLIEQKLILENNTKNGASWFYWIAALSIVNSLIVMSGSQMNFVVGLGITQIIDALGRYLGSMGNIVSLCLNLVIAGIFFSFGIFANKGHKIAFIVGMALYALDGLLFIVAMDWLGFGFHIFALFCMYGGLSASIKHKKLLENQTL